MNILEIVLKLMSVNISDFRLQLNENNNLNNINIHFC